MKRTLLFVTIAAGMAACNTSPKTASETTIAPADTAGLAQFQEWKAVNERKDPNTYYMQDVQYAAAAPVAAPRKTAVRRSSPATAPAPAPVATKKKGWSKAAKGATIGTASGAAAGAIINKKNRVVGGVIGGVVGGGLGYVIGRGMDKRDGRY